MAVFDFILFSTFSSFFLEASNLAYFLPQDSQGHEHINKSHGVSHGHSGTVSTLTHMHMLCGHDQRI